MPGHAPPGRDAEAEISREQSPVSAPTIADVSQQPPAEMLEQGGDAALRTLGTVVAGAAAPAAPTGPPAPGPESEPLPPVADAAGSPAAAGPAAEALTKRDTAAAAGEASAAQADGVRQGVAKLAAAPVELGSSADSDADADADADPAAAAEAERQRGEASAMLSSFLGTVAKRADEILGMGATVPAHMKAAAATSVDGIATAVDAQSAGISAHIAELRAQASHEARAARALVDGRHAATTAALTQATSAARERISGEYDASMQAIDARVTAQLRVIDECYRQGDERFRRAGRTVGAEAEQRGSQMAADYMRGLVDEDDSLLDGPLTYNRGKARADAAREISAAYKHGLEDEANKQADQAQQGKGRDVESVQTTARQAREALTAQHTSILATLAEAESTTMRQADEARTRLTASIATALEGAEQALATQEVTLIDNLRATARTQSATVERRSAELTAKIQDQVSQAAEGLQRKGTELAGQLQGQQTPPLDQLAAAIGDASAELDVSVGGIRTQLEQGQATSTQQIAAAGAAVSDGLASSTQAGKDGATATASQAESSLASLGASATETFGAVQQSHAKTTATTVTTALAGFKSAVDGVQRTYDQMSTGLKQGFEQSATGLEQGLRGALPTMESEIRKQAEEAASHVPPRWKSVVKWVLIIAVIVVVALVIGPFVIGAVGAALGAGTLLTGIVAGAIIGAATSATIQVINNWAENRPLGEGVAKAALIGAISGAVGGGFGAWAGQLGQQGVRIASTAFRQFALETVADIVTDTAINFATGGLSWENFGMSVLSAVAGGAAMHGLGKIKVVEGIQTRVTTAGESFGGTIRTGFGGSPPTIHAPTSAPDATAGDTSTTTPHTDKTPGVDTTTPHTDHTPADASTTPHTDHTPADASTTPHDDQATTPHPDQTPAGDATPPHADQTPGDAQVSPASGMRPADGELLAGLPSDLRARVPVHVDPSLAPGTVRVHYDIDADGLVTGIHIRAGSAATANDIRLHAGTVRAMESYAGFSGRVRALKRRIGELVGARGEPAPGSRAWETRLEVQKLPGVISDRLSRLQAGGPDDAGQAALRTEVADLEAQLAHHQRVLDELGLDGPGRGFVAADARDQPLIDRTKDLGVEGQRLSEVLGNRKTDPQLLERLRTELRAGMDAADTGVISKESMAKVLGAVGRAENDAQIHNALAELRQAQRVAGAGGVAAGEPVHIGVNQAKAAELGVDITPIHEADVMYRDADGAVHVDEVKGTANALVEKLRAESTQLDNLASWQRAQAGRVAEVVVDTDVGWTKLFGEAQVGPDGKVVRGGATGLDTVIDSGLTLRIGERRFTTDQLIALRQSILDDMQAFGAGTTKSFGQYFKEIPTLDALAARLGRGLP